jgi:hypothetical protein
MINALRPYIPVVVVGDRTYGKPVGQYGITFCDKVIAPVAFTIRNVADKGDYFDGIPADCTAGDDITHDLGDVAEASLAEALQVGGQALVRRGHPNRSHCVSRTRPGAPRAGSL